MSSSTLIAMNIKSLSQLEAKLHLKKISGCKLSAARDIPQAILRIKPSQVLFYTDPSNGLITYAYSNSIDTSSLMVSFSNNGTTLLNTVLLKPEEYSIKNDILTIT